MMTRRIYAILSTWSTANVQRTWKNTSHLGSHHVLPTGRLIFKLKLLGCQFLSSRSPPCFLSKVLLFSLAALPVHQNSLLCFADQPLCMFSKWLRGHINKCTNWYLQMSPTPLSVRIEIKWRIIRKCSTHFVSNFKFLLRKAICFTLAKLDFILVSLLKHLRCLIFI